MPGPPPSPDDSIRRDGPPTLNDPSLVTARDGTLFVCWVERIGEWPRWVFVSVDRTRYTGPIYAGQDSLEAIRALVGDWWSTKQELGQG